MNQSITTALPDTFIYTSKNIEQDRRNIQQRIDNRLKAWHNRRSLHNLKTIEEMHYHGPDCLLPVLHNNHLCSSRCNGKIHFPEHRCNLSGGGKYSRCQPNLILIDKETFLYGCIKSGKHHICRSMIKPELPILRSISDDCIDILITEDADHICIFSGVSLRTTITHYTEKSQRNSFLTGNDNDDDEDASNSNSSGESLLTPYEKNADFLETTQNLTRYYKTAALGSTNNNNTQKPDTKDNSSSVLPKKSHTPKNRRGLPPNPARKLEIIKTLELKATAIINQLLYDKNAMESITEQRSNQFQVAFSNKILHYTKYCNTHKKLPSAHVIMEIYYGEQDQFPVPNKIDDNSITRKLIHSYSQICVKLWKTMRSKCRLKTCNYHQFVIGFLYMMKRDVTKDGNLITPKDVFLEKFLPNERDLRFYVKNVDFVKQQSARKKEREKSKSFEDSRDAPLLLLENQSSIIRKIILRSEKNIDIDSDSDNDTNIPKLNRRKFISQHVTASNLNYRSYISIGSRYINTSIIYCSYDELKKAMCDFCWTRQDYLNI